MQKQLKAMVRLAAGAVLAAVLAGCNDDGGGGGSDSLHALASTGQPIAEAAAYKTANPSPLILVYQQDPAVDDPYYSTWEDQLPATWVADRISELEQVCYFGPETFVVVQSKEYQVYINGFPVENTRPQVLERRRYQLPVILKEAQTGNTIAQFTLQGSMPGAFGDTATLAGDIYGSRPELADLQAWLAPHVEP